MVLQRYPTDGLWTTQRVKWMLMMSRRTCVLLFLIIWCAAVSAETASNSETAGQRDPTLWCGACSSTSWSIIRRSRSTRVSPLQNKDDLIVSPRKFFLTLRGGANKPKSTKKKTTTSTGTPATKKKKKKATKSTANSESSSSSSDDTSRENGDKKGKKISQALHDKDAAQAMGDAIRARAHQWRPLSTSSDSIAFLNGIDASLTSVGLAMGAADYRTTRRLDQDEPPPAAGGVQAATTSVVVHYFLKSHGGAHALQSVCSLLATLSGLGASLLVAQSPPVRLLLLRRCLVFAMTKHLAGILAACVLTARAVPEVGILQARQRMQDFVQDPVAQYVFYAACLLVWLPSSMDPSLELLWWQQNPLVPALLTGPILLREIVSTTFVLSDVLLLWVYTNQHVEESSNEGDPMWMTAVRGVQATVNAVMSLLVTPQVWRTADALQRQAILARLVARVSLALEVLVGCLLVADAVQRVWSLGLGTKTNARPSIGSVVKTALCARLYVHFLLARRRKIIKLANKIRGGAADLPLYVLNAMLDPKAAMGLESSTSAK